MIIFREVTARNFFKIGNTEVTIPLDHGKVVGIHGPNGSGKSTICEMISYALFGKSYRPNVRVADFVNDRNKKNLIVSIRFDIGDDEYRIVRGKKPDFLKIEKNGEELKNLSSRSLDDEFIQNEILRFDQDLLIQTMVIGKERQKSYMDLSAADRREFLEQIFGLSYFSELKEEAKRTISTVESEQRELEIQIERIKTKIEHTLSLIEQQERSIGEQIQHVISQIESVETELTLEESGYKTIKDTIDQEKKLQLQLRYNDFSQRKNSLDRSVIEIEYQIKNREQEIRSLKNKDKKCPTCGSEIDLSVFDERIKEAIIENLSAEQKIFELKEQIRSEVESFADIRSQLEFFNAKEIECNKIMNSIQSKKTLISMLTKQITTLNEKKKLDLPIEELKQENKEFEKRLKNKKTILKYLYFIKNEYLSDRGYKTFIINRYRERLESSINRSLSEYDLPMKVIFKEDLTIEISYITGKEFKFSNLSSGQKQRFDLSIWNGFNEAMKIRGNIDTNLMIFDEVLDGSLDVAGQEVFLNSLKQIVEKNNKSCFIISHGMDHFQHEIRVDVVDGFSRYQISEQIFS